MTDLDLGSNSIGDTGAVYLAEALAEGDTASGLVSLVLARNQISDAGAAGLGRVLAPKEESTPRACTRLATLDLRDNYVGNVGAAALAGGLAANSSLLHLSLFHNEVRERGGAALVEALAANTTLLSLNLECNFVTSKRLKADLEEALAYNRAEAEERARGRRDPRGAWTGVVGGGNRYANNVLDLEWPRLKRVPKGGRKERMKGVGEMELLRSRLYWCRCGCRVALF